MLGGRAVAVLGVCCEPAVRPRRSDGARCRAVPVARPYSGRMCSASVIDQLRLGDHVCWAFDGDDQRLAAMARFVAAGVRDGQKVLYLTESLLPLAVRAGLHSNGVEVDGALASGQLEIRTADETYLARGRF